MLLCDPIVSIPHSGTRSLANHLGKADFYHFHQLALNPEWQVAGVVHVPVRDPLSHAVSWVCFEGDLGHKRTQRSLKDGEYSFFAEFFLMVEFLSKNVVFHKVEDIPRTAGFGPKGSSKLRLALKERDLEFLQRELPSFFEFMQDSEVTAFYDSFYKDRWY